MVKEIHAKLKKDGNTTIVKMKIDGKLIYLKSNNSNYSQQIISQMREKGAHIKTSKSSWIQVDIFGEGEIAKKIGNKVYDFNFDIVYNLREKKTLKDIEKYFKEAPVIEKDGIKVSLDIEKLEKEQARKLILQKKILTEIITNVKELNDKSIEEGLHDFYINQYLKVGFKVRDYL